MNESQTTAAGGAAAEQKPYAPYRSETGQVLFRARMIFKARRSQFLPWAACYVLTFFLPAFLFEMVSGYFSGDWAFFIHYISYVLIPPLLLGMYAWLEGIMAGDPSPALRFMEPFKWIRSHSPGRYLAIAGSLIAVFFCASTVILMSLSGFASVVGPMVNSLAARLSSGGAADSSYIMLLPPPLDAIPGALMGQWVVGFFAIHAIQTKGLRIFGFVKAQGVCKRTLLVELRLLLKYVLLPYVLYDVTCMYMYDRIDSPFSWYLYVSLMQFAFLGFGLVYYPMSAIARSLIVKCRPRVLLDGPPPEPALLSQIDSGYRREKDDPTLEEDKPAQNAPQL